MTWSSALGRVLALELGIMGSSRFFLVVMAFFGFIAVSGFLTVFDSRDVVVRVKAESHERSQALCRILAAAGLRVREAGPGLTQWALQIGATSATLEETREGCRLAASSVRDRQYMEHRVAEALERQELRAMTRALRARGLPEPTLSVVALGNQRASPLITTVTSRILCCLWLIAAVLAVVSWLLTAPLYDRLTQRYRRWHLLCGKWLGCALLALAPLAFAVLAVGIASGFRADVMAGFLLASTWAITLGVLVGIAVGALPLAFGGRFKDIAFAGIMGTSMLWLGLVMVAGIVNPLGSMLPALRPIALWNPLYLLCRLNEALAGHPGDEASSIPVLLLQLFVLILFSILAIALLVEWRARGWWARGRR
jgi:hypothetical protein